MYWSSRDTFPTWNADGVSSGDDDDDDWGRGSWGIGAVGLSDPHAMVSDE